MSVNGTDKGTKIRVNFNFRESENCPNLLQIVFVSTERRQHHSVLPGGNFESMGTEGQIGVLDGLRSWRLEFKKQKQLKVVRLNSDRKSFAGELSIGLNHC